MTTWPTDATSDVAPGSRPASSSETPSAVAVATIPAMAALVIATQRGLGRPGRVGRVAVVVTVTGASSCLGADIRTTTAHRFAGRVAASAPDMRAHARPSRRSTVIGTPNARLRTSSRRTVSIGPAATARPSARTSACEKPGRDLLDVVRDEDDRRRAVAARPARPGRGSGSRARRGRGWRPARRAAGRPDPASAPARSRSAAARPRTASPYGWSATTAQARAHRAGPAPAPGRRPRRRATRARSPRGGRSSPG